MFDCVIACIFKCKKYEKNPLLKRRKVKCCHNLALDYSYYFNDGFVCLFVYSKRQITLKMNVTFLNNMCFKKKVFLITTETLIYELSSQLE